MSIELNPIYGKTEYISDYTIKNVDWKHTELRLLSFYGGKTRGQCLQLSLEEDHIQLTREEVLRLKSELIKWLELDTNLTSLIEI